MLRDRAQEHRVGSIIVPESATTPSSRGTVEAAGPGRVSKTGSRLPLDVRVGDRVLFGQYGGQDVTIGGTEYVIVREDEVHGVIEDE